MRTEPNIIITGTPGVGKTSHCTLLASNTGLKHLSINQIVKERECHEGWDEGFQSWIVDEDKVSDNTIWGRVFAIDRLIVWRFLILYGD